MECTEYFFEVCYSWMGGVRPIFTNLITARAGAQFYFIFVYIQFVILTPLLGKVLMSKYRWIGWVVTPLSTIAGVYYYLINGIELNKFFLLYGVYAV